MNRFARSLLSLSGVSIAVLSCIASCNKPAGAPAAGPPAAPKVPVNVATATSADVPIILRTIGSVESKSSIILKAQIAGRITEVGVEDGSDVKAGQVLVKLDPRPFAADLAQAEASLARSKEIALDAHRMVDRIAAANVSAVITNREPEEAASRAAVADADVLSNEAQVELARVRLAYTTIAAPFAGRLGSFLVRPGSIVKENDTNIAELAQMDPIDVTFAVPEENIPAIREALSKSGLAVNAVPSGDTRPPAIGSLTFIDNKVDASTSTIRLKGTFSNPDRRLWPGQFANVTLTLGQDVNMVLVPESAVQTTQGGAAIYVVKPDRTVELKLVKVRRVFEGKSLIEAGIAAGDTVVTDGQLRIGAGSIVDIKNAGAAEAKH